MGIEALNIRPTKNELVVSADFVKTNFLFGVDLTDDFGNVMPNSLIEFYIKSAQRWVERELDISLQPLSITEESHDFYFSDYASFSFISLYRLPVRKVSKVSLQFPVNSDRIDFNPDWFRVESNRGQLNLIPTAGNISSFIISQGGTFLPSLSASDYLPHVFYVDYEAGFEKKEDVPEDILELVGMKASMGPLNIAGDLIAGAGIAAKSLGLDGLSQSVSTTSSATNAGYGARILQYNKEVELRLASLKYAYRGIQMAVA